MAMVVTAIVESRWCSGIGQWTDLLRRSTSESCFITAITSNCESQVYDDRWSRLSVALMLLKWRAKYRQRCVVSKNKCLKIPLTKIQQHRYTVVLHCCKGDTASQWEMAQHISCLVSREIGNIGVVRTPQPWTDWLKIWHILWLRRLTSYAKFHKIRPDRGLPAICWNVHLAYFLIFRSGDFSRASTEKNSTFQALNGLKCSTVCNLYS